MPPPELAACLQQLELHYSEFEEKSGGANGYVYFARNRISNAEVVIKFYAGEPGTRRHDEPRLLSTINSPNVLRIYDARNVSDDWAYFITPRCDGGDIDNLIKGQPSVHEAIDVVLGITHGVSAIHGQNMVHRDLKPANIVIDGGIPLIADFGSVRLIPEGSNEATASRHSILYRPPESFATNIYSWSGDVYQIGLVAYQLLGGSLPYDGTAYLSARERREYDRIPDPVDQSLFVDGAIRRRAEAGKLVNFGSLPPWISGAARRVLRNLTHPDPADRVTSMADIAAAMSKLRSTHHNWRFVGVSARLVTTDRVIELQAAAGNLFEAFQRKQGDFRRVPGMEPSTLTDLVKRCSERVTSH